MRSLNGGDALPVDSRQKAVTIIAAAEAAMFTFVVTLSGVSVAKIGSPFWGALAGVIAMVIASTGAFERLRPKRPARN